LPLLFAEAIPLMSEDCFVTMKIIGRGKPVDHEIEVTFEMPF
jgi:hypothetical protein